MNSLKTYWLSRAPGSAAEGPFTLAQLTAMYGTGSVTAQAVLCEVGADAWIGVVELMEGDGQMAFIHSRKNYAGGSTVLAVCLFLIGLCLLISPLFLVGLAIMAASGLVRTKYRVEYYCSGCGNTVAATSLKCPECKAGLDLPPETWRQGLVKVFWWAVYAFIFFWLGLALAGLFVRP